MNRISILIVLKIWTGIKIRKTRPVIDDKNALILLSNVK